MSAIAAVHQHRLAMVAGILERARLARGWSKRDLARQAFGTNEKGTPVNDAYLSSVLNARLKHIPGDRLLTNLAKALELDPQLLIEVRDGAREAPRVEDKDKLPVLAPGPRARAPFRSSVPISDPALPFTFSINHEGLATLRVNLVDVPPDKAFRAMSALTAAGLLPTGTEAPG